MDWNLMGWIIAIILVVVLCGGMMGGMMVRHRNGTDSRPKGRDKDEGKK